MKKERRIILLGFFLIIVSVGLDFLMRRDLVRIFNNGTDYWGAPLWLERSWRIHCGLTWVLYIGIALILFGWIRIWIKKNRKKVIESEKKGQSSS